MSETIANLARKNARDAMQRVTALEQVVPQLIGMVQNLQSQFSQSVEILDALVQNFGVEVVENTVIANRRQKAITKSEEEQKQMATLIEQGVMKPVSVVGERTLVVFKEQTPDGKPTEPVSRVQFMFEQLQPQFREQLTGKGAGTVITSPAGNTFTVQEVYEIVAKEDVALKTEGSSENTAPVEAKTETVGPLVPEAN